MRAHAARLATTLLCATLLCAAYPAREAHATTPCDPALAGPRAERLRLGLAAEHARARRWDLTWAGIFGGLALAQGGLVLAEWTPLGEYDSVAEASLTVGAIKSAIGATSHLLLPLRVTRAPAPTGDACADLAAAEAGLAATKQAEKRTFVLKLVGGFVVNAGGSVYQGLAEDDWGEAALSFGLGYGLAVASVLFMPRRAARGKLDAEVAFVPAPGGGFVVLAGELW